MLCNLKEECDRVNYNIITSFRESVINIGLMKMKRSNFKMLKFISKVKKSYSKKLLYYESS